MGTNSVKGMTSRKILDKLLQLKTALLGSNENFKVTLSQPMTMVRNLSSKEFIYHARNSF